MVNNLNPASRPDGLLQESRPDNLLLPPQTMANIGDLLSAGGVSWKWYTGGRNDGKLVDREYCAMCDTLVFFRSTITAPHRAKLQHLHHFSSNLKHPASSPHS